MSIFALIGAILAILWLLGMRTLGPLDIGGLLWLSLFLHLLLSGVAVLPTLVRRRRE
jgi:hypothetical protein